MKSSKVSVIVPVYNAEKYLHQCIDSILSQSYKNIELLLINDGSRDSSGKICDIYSKKDDRVHVFHEENGGVSKARNIGLEYVCGDYICFVDSDDWISSTMLEELMCIEKKRKCDLLFYGFNPESEMKLLIDPNAQMRLSGFYNREEILKIIYELEQNKLFGWTWNKLYKSCIIQKNHIRFNEQLSIQEDHVFTLEYIGFVERMGVINYKPYFYRIDSNSLMNKEYPYSMLKIKECLVFEGRLKLLDCMASKYNLLYKQFAIRQFLLNMLFFFNCLQENRIKELDFVRKAIRQYSYAGRTIRLFILYLMSFLPIVILDMVIALICSTKIKCRF